MHDLSMKYAGAMLVTFSIMLIFVLGVVKVQVDREESYLCEVTHEAQKSMKECPAHESSTSWLLTAAFGICFLLLGAGSYILFSPQHKKEHPVSSSPDPEKLDGEERTIYGMLRQHEGSMYQSDIVRESRLSKVRVTRILDRMEGKRLIGRKRRGMTNIVVLE